MRRRPQQALTLLQGLSDQPEVAVPQVSQPAVDQTAAARACAGRDITRVNQQDPDAANRRVPSDRSALDARADHDDVEASPMQLFRITTHPL